MFSYLFQMRHNPPIEFLPPQVCARIIQIRFHFFIRASSFYFQKLFEMYINFHFEARFRVTRKMHDVFSFRVLQISIQRKKEKEMGNCIYHRRKNIVYLRSCLEWNTYTLVSRKCRGALSIDKAQQRR